MKKVKSGISLIVLVITIIIIIILATAVIVSIVGNNPIENARKAVDDSNIKTYTEQIEMIKAKIMLENDEYEFPTIYQIKEKLDKEKWARSTEIIMDEGIEKLKLITKEGYIFYITANETEYKGKGKVVDTSALKRDDVIELKAEEETSNGQNVRITSKAEDYYTLKYKIGEGDKWIEIESGSTVEVPFGETIYAKLFYGLNAGVEFKLKIGESNPTIVVSSIDTSNMKRKTDTVLANLFDITWGSDGTGTVEYEVTGNLLFDGSSVDCTSKTNTKDFELGTYNVKCTIKNPAESYEASAQKEVKITTLADTSVENASGSNVNASAIYSEYDLAYFRDLVNGSNQSQNARLIENINLDKVCSTSLSWVPIGNSSASKKYQGIFDGNNKKVDNIYINSSNAEQGLFGYAENATIKNIELGTGNITGANKIGGLVGYAKNSNIDNITNSATQVNANTKYLERGIYYSYDSGEATNEYVSDNVYSLGGIIGKSEETNIQNCKNNINIQRDNGEFVGGIVGFAKSESDSRIYNCINMGNLDNSNFLGGIVGIVSGNIVIENCINNGTISTSNNGTATGGIAGALAGKKILNCTNTNEITGGCDVGGIVGSLVAKSHLEYAILENCTNLSNVTGEGSVEMGWLYDGAWIIELANNTGGIAGYCERAKINNSKNEGKIECVSNAELKGLGGIAGEVRTGEITNSYNNGIISGNKATCIGGIVGIGYKDVNISNCYNKNIVSGYNFVGGIAGVLARTNIRYCYNTQTITATATNTSVGGITSQLVPSNANDYTNNSIWYCYNVGKVIGEKSGSIFDYANYHSGDYVYGLTGTAPDVIVQGDNYKGDGTHYGMLGKTDLISTILSNYGSNFKEDKENINEGYPILSWQ